MSTNLYQEAIADAKAVRASAMANAKAALAEAFEPKLKEMLKKSMEEAEEELDEMSHQEEELDETQDMQDETISEEDMEEEVNHLDEEALDEILAELDELEEGSDEELDESEDEDLNENIEEAEDEEDETEESEEEVEDETESDEETKVVDITLGDLVDAIKAAMAGENNQAPEADMETSETGEDEISLDEILAELDEEKEEDLDEQKKDKDDELEEAKNTIAVLQKELNEINLLNAKLLYINKIFKAKTLTESQKVKVLNAFDKATSVKEVKNTYSILKETFETKKTSIKESIGFASKPVGSIKTNTDVVKVDPVVERMQRLAGL